MPDSSQACNLQHRVLHILRRWRSYKSYCKILLKLSQKLKKNGIICKYERSTIKPKQSGVLLNRKGIKRFFCFRNRTDESYDNILLIASIIYSCQQLIKLLWASKIVIIIMNKDVNSLYYSAQLISGTLLDIKFSNTSTQEIEKIINSLIRE